MKVLIGITLIFAVNQALSDGLKKNETRVDLPTNSQLLEVKLAAMEAKLAQQGASQAALEARLARQGAQNAALSARVAAQDARATACEKWRDEQEQRDAKILSDIQALRTSNTDRSSNVSFLAVAASTQSVPGYAAVKFTILRHNAAPTGYGYDSVIHRFRCPVDGVYAFQFTIPISYCSTRWYLFSLMKESAILSTAKVYVDDCYQIMSGSAVTRCSKGDYVFVKNDESGSRDIYNDAHFSGFKIY